MVEENTILTATTAPAGRGAHWLLGAFDYFKRDWLAWILVMIIYVLISFAAAVIPILGNIALTIFMPVLMGGLMLGCKAQDDGGNFTIGHLFQGFSEHAGQLCLIGAMYFAAVIALVIFMIIVAVVMLGGMEVLSQLDSGNRQAIMEHGLTLLLVVLITLALSIPILMMLWFSPALVVLEGESAFSALRLSVVGCAANIIPFLIYGLLGLVLSIVATIPLGAGWFLLGPMIIISVYLAYKDIFVRS